MNGLFENHAIKVAAGLIIGLIAIMYFSPPHTPCQSRHDFYLDSIKPYQKTFGKKLGFCKEHAEQGGCFPLFEVAAKLESKLHEMGSECRSDIADDKLTKQWLGSSLELFVRVAWGSKPPSSYLNKNGWLELSQIVQYCKLRTQWELIYGQPAWSEFIDFMLSDLPGAVELGRNESWNRSILSDPCQYSF